MTWTDDAACRGTDPELWFPTSNVDAHRKYRICRAICAQCPVIAECEADAYNYGDIRYGMRAGKTPRELIRERAGRLNIHHRRKRRHRGKLEIATQGKRAGGVIHTHGTRSSYTRGCGCHECLEANREYERTVRKNRRKGTKS